MSEIPDLDFAALLKSMQNGDKLTFICEDESARGAVYPYKMSYYVRKERGFYNIQGGYLPDPYDKNFNEMVFFLRNLAIRLSEEGKVFKVISPLDLTNYDFVIFPKLRKGVVCVHFPGEAPMQFDNYSAIQQFSEKNPVNLPKNIVLEISDKVRELMQSNAHIFGGTMQA